MHTEPYQEHEQQKSGHLWYKGATISNGNCGYHAFAEIFVRLIREKPEQVNSEFFNPKNRFFAPARAFLKDSLRLREEFRARELQSVFLGKGSHQFTFNSGDIAQKVAPIFLLLNVQQYQAVVRPPPPAHPDTKAPPPPTPHLSIQSAFFADTETNSLPPAPAAHAFGSLLSSLSFSELQFQASRTPLLTQLSQPDIQPLLSYITNPEESHDNAQAQECFSTKSFPYVFIEDFRCLQRLIFNPLAQPYSKEYDEVELNVLPQEAVYPFLIAQEEEIPLLPRHAGQDYAMYMPSNGKNHFEYAIHRDKLTDHPITPAAAKTAVANKTLPVTSTTIAPPPISVIRRMEENDCAPLDIILSPTAQNFYDQYQEQSLKGQPLKDWMPYEKDSPCQLIDIYNVFFQLNKQLETLATQPHTDNQKISSVEAKIAICAVALEQLSADNYWNIDRTIITCPPIQIRAVTPEKAAEAMLTNTEYHGATRGAYVDWQSVPGRTGTASFEELDFDLIPEQSQQIPLCEWEIPNDGRGVPSDFTVPNPSEVACNWEDESPLRMESEDNTTQYWPQAYRKYSPEPDYGAALAQDATWFQRHILAPTPQERRRYSLFEDDASAAAATTYRTTYEQPFAVGEISTSRAADLPVQSAGLSPTSPVDMRHSSVSDTNQPTPPSFKRGLAKAMSIDSAERFFSGSSSPTGLKTPPVSFGPNHASFSTATAPKSSGPNRAAVSASHSPHSTTATLSGLSSPLKIKQIFKELEQKSRQDTRVYQKELSTRFHVGSLSVENTSTGATASIKLCQDPSKSHHANEQIEKKLIADCAQCFQKPHLHIELNISSKNDIQNLLNFIKKTETSEVPMSYSFDLKNLTPATGHPAVELLMSHLKNPSLSLETVTAQLQRTLDSYPAVAKTSLTTGATAKVPTPETVSPRLSPYDK